MKKRLEKAYQFMMDTIGDNMDKEVDITDIVQTLNEYDDNGESFIITAWEVDQSSICEDECMLFEGIETYPIISIVLGDYDYPDYDAVAYGYEKGNGYCITDISVESI